MQSVTIKYLGPTNLKGSRLKAFAEAGSVTIPYPHELNHDEGRAKALKAFLDKMERWPKTGWVLGGNNKEDYFVHVDGYKVES